MILFIKNHLIIYMINLNIDSCDYLEITEYKNDFNKDKRKTIMLTSRVHPGESMASYVI